jgi:hypothetical protein
MDIYRQHLSLIHWIVPYMEIWHRLELKINKQIDKLNVPSFGVAIRSIGKRGSDCVDGGGGGGGGGRCARGAGQSFSDSSL